MTDRIAPYPHQVNYARWERYLRSVPREKCAYPTCSLCKHGGFMLCKRHRDEWKDSGNPSFMDWLWPFLPHDCFIIYELLRAEDP